MRGLFYDVHAGVSTNLAVSTIHEAAEVFDPHTEQVCASQSLLRTACPLPSKSMLFC
jgi:hypothetical protein